MKRYPISKNTFKARLISKKQSIGLWSSLCSIIGTEVIADAGFDWLLFDTEHSPIEISGLLPLLQASSRGTAHSAVRVAWNNPVLIKRVLDIGAQTIFAPFIQNANEAVHLVTACHYPPRGIRGVAGSIRASRFGRTSNYIQGADEQICIIAQIETSEAIENISAIAEVEGIDGVFVGPSDLSASMGFPGNVRHPKVQAQLKNALNLIQQTGKPAGTLATNPQEANTYIEWGCTFVAVGVDVGLLTKAADNLIAKFKGRK